MLIVDKSF